MQITTYADPAAYLERARPYLERNEAATALILGIAQRLADHGVETPPYLALIESPAGIELAVMMTPPHHLVIWGEQAPPEESLALLARDLRDGGWSVPSALGPPAIVEPWLEQWRALTGQGWRLGLRERIYELTAVVAPPAPSGRMRQASEADFELAARWAWEFQIEAIGPDAQEEDLRKMVRRRIEEGALYLWDDGQPVAMAGHGRETARSSTISLVYTPPSFRRRGYAMALVAALSQRLLDGGKSFCTLFTDLANPTSNSIYQQIGYRPVCDFNEYRLDEPR